MSDSYTVSFFGSWEPDEQRRVKREMKDQPPDLFRSAMLEAARRDSEAVDALTRLLVEQVRQVLDTHNCHVEFLVDRKSSFDFLASSAVRQFQRERGFEDFSLELIVPFSRTTSRTVVPEYHGYYDCVLIYPISPRGTDARRDREVLRRSDLAVFYVPKHSGVAWQAMESAKRMGVPICDLEEGMARAGKP